MQNQMMWIQGAYFYDAVSKAIANSFSKNAKHKYIEKPFDFGKTEIPKEQVQEKIKSQNSFWASFKGRLEN